MIQSKELPVRVLCEDTALPSMFVAGVTGLYQPVLTALVSSSVRMFQLAHQ